MYLITYWYKSSRALIILVLSHPSQECVKAHVYTQEDALDFLEKQVCFR